MTERYPDQWHSVLVTENGLVGIHLPSLERAQAYQTERRRVGNHGGWQILGGMIGCPDGSVVDEWGDIHHRVVPVSVIPTGAAKLKTKRYHCIVCGEWLPAGTRYVPFAGQPHCMKCADSGSARDIDHPLNEQWKRARPLRNQGDRS